MANSTQSLRSLVTGGGTIPDHYVNAGGDVLIFSQAQSFKEGAVVKESQYGRIWTVRGGSGTTWQMYQSNAYGPNNVSFYTSDPSTSRARGGATAKWAPSAKHFVYMAPVDGSGNPDWYAYIDTLYPEKGVHPYTRDRWTGIVRTTDKIADSINDAVLIPDLAERLKALDGLPPVYTP